MNNEEPGADTNGIGEKTYCATEALMEAYRRIAFLIEKHPYLSGIQTDEHLLWLRWIATRWLPEVDLPDPSDMVPNYEYELDL